MMKGKKNIIEYLMMFFHDAVDTTH